MCMWQVLVASDAGGFDSRTCLCKVWNMFVIALTLSVPHTEARYQRFTLRPGMGCQRFSPSPPICAKSTIDWPGLLSFYKAA